MTAAEKYQQLVDSGLIVPVTITPPGFKFPTMLVYMPSIATTGVIDQAQVDRVMRNAQLERSHQPDQC
jgi:hypothetical protein